MSFIQYVQVLVSRLAIDWHQQPEKARYFDVVQFCFISALGFCWSAAGWTRQIKSSCNVASFVRFLICFLFSVVVLSLFLCFRYVKCRNLSNLCRK